MLAQVDFDRLNTVVGLKPELGTLGGVISSFLPPLFVIAGLLLLIYLLYGGFSLMLSRGDAKAVEGARHKLTNAVVGFVIIIVAFFLVQLIGAIFGIEQFGELFQ